MNKVCTSCNKAKNIEEFKEHPRYRDGRVTWCRECTSEYRKKHYRKNVSRVKELSKSYYQSNKDTYLKQHADYRDNNREKMRQITADWAKENKGRCNAKSRQYQLSKKNRCPKWLTEIDKEKIRLMYENCPEGYEVDHIYPLQGKNVSGLHVPDNLQYLSIEQNRKKSNKY